jgi:tetratricopeptide (TPR) repeat protein
MVLLGGCVTEQQYTVLLVEDDRGIQRALAEALRLYPEEAEFHACMGWATWLSLAPGEGAAAQARPLLEKALQLNPRIARALGRAQEAEAEFEKALLCNPRCAEALQELRLKRK